MKTNLNPMSLYKRPRLQHMKRLAVTALTAVMLSGLVGSIALSLFLPLFKLLEEFGSQA